MAQHRNAGEKRTASEAYLDDEEMQLARPEQKRYQLWILHEMKCGVVGTEVVMARHYDQVPEVTGREYIPGHCTLNSGGRCNNCTHEKRTRTTLLYKMTKRN